MDVNKIIAIIRRHRAKFRARDRSGPQEDMDEGVRLMPTNTMCSSQRLKKVDLSYGIARKNAEAEAQMFGDQAQSDREAIWRNGIFQGNFPERLRLCPPRKRR